MPLETHSAAEYLTPPAPADADTQGANTGDQGETAEAPATAPEVDPVTGLPLEELRKGYLRQSDYTRKREQEAQQLREAKAEAEELRGQMAAFGPTKEAVDRLQAIYAANPQAQAELEAMFSRYGMPTAPATAKSDPKVDQRLKALEDRDRTRTEEMNALLSEDALNYGMDKYGLTRAQSVAVLTRMGDEDAPILPSRRTTTAMRKCFDTAYRDLNFARAQTTGQQDLLKKRAEATRAATVKGGAAPPPPPSPARPTTWDEAEEIALRDIRRELGA